MESKKVKITQNRISIELSGKKEIEVLEHFEALEEFWTYDDEGNRNGSTLLVDGVNAEDNPGDTTLLLKKGMVLEVPRKMAIHLVKTGDALQFIEADPDYDGKGLEQPRQPVPKEVLSDQGDALKDIDKEVDKIMNRKGGKTGKKGNK